MSFTSDSPSFWPAIGHDDLHSRFNVASSAIIFYDYGLVLTREVELIWRQRWKPTTVLYIIARYLGLVIATVQILGGAPGISLSDRVKPLNLLAGIHWCNIVGRSWSWGMVALACTVYAIMSIRVFAIYSRSKRMRIVLIICFLAASVLLVITDGLALVFAVGSTSKEYVLSGTGFCTTPMAPMVFFFDGIPSLCIELLFLLLATRVLVKYVREMREHVQTVEFGHGRSDSLAILWDHVLHFSCYLVLSVMQVAAISTNGDTDGSRWYRSIVIFFVTIQQCVLVPRLVISTRRYFSQRDYVSDGVTDLGAMAFAYNPDVES